MSASDNIGDKVARAQANGYYVKVSVPTAATSKSRTPTASAMLVLTGAYKKIAAEPDFIYLREFHLAGTRADLKSYLTAGGLDNAAISKTFADSYNRDTLADKAWSDLWKSESAAQRVAYKAFVADKAAKAGKSADRSAPEVDLRDLTRLISLVKEGKGKVASGDKKGSGKSKNDMDKAAIEKRVADHREKGKATDVSKFNGSINLLSRANTTGKDRVTLPGFPTVSFTLRTGKTGTDGKAGALKFLTGVGYTAAQANDAISHAIRANSGVDVVASPARSSARVITPPRAAARAASPAARVASPSRFGAIGGARASMQRPSFGQTN